MAGAEFPEDGTSQCSINAPRWVLGAHVTVLASLWLLTCNGAVQLSVWCCDGRYFVL